MKHQYFAAESPKPCIYNPVSIKIRRMIYKVRVRVRVKINIRTMRRVRSNVRARTRVRIRIGRMI